MKYYAIFKYPGLNENYLLSADTPENEPDNRRAVEKLGDRLLKENIIKHYQLMVVVGDEIKRA